MPEKFFHVTIKSMLRNSLITMLYTSIIKKLPSRRLQIFSLVIPAMFISIVIHAEQVFSAGDYYQMTVEDVRFEGLNGIMREDIEPLMFIGKGDIFSPSKISKTIKYLYFKGLFSQIYVDASKGKSGVILNFSVQGKKWVKDIKIKGNKKVSDNDILLFLPLKENTEFTDEAFFQIEEKILSIYEKKFYFNTTVAVEKLWEDDVVKILIEINEGPPCILSGIEFKGAKVFSNKELMKVVDSRIGKPLILTSLEKDKKNLIDFFHKSGYLEVEISEPIITYNPEGTGATASFEVSPGPVIEIRSEGNNYFSDNDLIKIIKAREGDIVEADLLKVWEKKIEASYRKAGYHFIQVRGQLDETESRKRVRLNINEGKRYFAGKINFKGNNKISPKELLKELSVDKGIFAGPYSEELLNKDIENLKDVYRKKGFLNIEISKNIIFSKSDNKAGITIVIHEGVQTLIRSINFKGAALFNSNHLKKIAQISEGIPFSRVKMEGAILGIVKEYLKKGYIYAKVAKEAAFSDDNSSVDLNFNINEGNRVTLGKIILSGNRYTKDKVILRELTLKEGDIYDPEKISQDRQRVYRMGLFRGVKYRQINESKRESVKDMILTVNEKKAGAVEIGIGYVTDIGIRGFVETYYNNLGGTGRRINFRGELSEVEEKFLLAYKEPWLLGKRMDGRINLLQQFTKKDSYDLEKQGVIFGVDKSVTDFLRVSLQYDIERDRYFNVVSGTDQDEGKSIIASAGPVIVRDSRDDPFNPTTGSVNLLRYEIAGRELQSDKEFHKVTVHSIWHYPATEKTVAAISLRAGYINLLGATSSVPLDRRFFLGGRTTIRGYNRDSVGPVNSAGSPVGGEKMININVEIRTIFAGKIAGLIFFDGGNVWKTYDAVNFSSIRTSFGSGIRYITPVGPLSLEYGHKISRRDGESPGRWYFTVGNIF